MAKADDGRIGTLIHAADLHLGAPFKGLSKDLDNPDLFKQLKERAKKAFDNLVEATIEKKADILVLAGDIYDGTDHVYEIQFQFQKGLKRLEEENIKVFLVHGNHDPFAEFQTLVELPDNVHVFESGKPQLEEVILKSGTKIEVAGVSFDKRSEKENLAKLFHDLEPVNKNLTVGILHTSIGGNKDHDDYAPCSVQDLEDAPIGYWALGHIHKREVHEMRMRKGAYRAYSGNLQGRSTKESECVSKGALEVAIYGHGFGEPEFFACDDDTVRFNRVSVDVTGAELLGDAYERVEAEVNESRGEFGYSCFAVSHVTITGRTKAHKELTKSKENGTIVEDIRLHCSGDKNGIVLKVKLSTMPQVDDEELRQGDGFAATLFKDLDAFKNKNSLDDVEDMLDELRISREIVTENFEEVLERVEQILSSEWANRNEVGNRNE